MTDQSLFQEESQNPQATPEQSNPQSPDNLFADQLQAIKNEEGKPKYSSVEEAIKALQHSQEYIPKVKSEKDALEKQVAELQEKLEAQKKLQEVLQGNSNQPQEPQAPQGIDESQIDKLLQDKLAAIEAAKTADSNLSNVSKTLQEKFGANAKAEINKKASELGMNVSQLEELAKNNPKMVLSLFGASSVNTKPALGGHTLPQGDNKIEVKRPEKSLLQGSTATQQRDFMRQIKAAVYQKHGITE